MNLSFFLGLVLLGAGAAYFRAKHAGDTFNIAALTVFVTAAGVLVVSLGAKATLPVCIVLACVCVSAATDLSSGYIYDAVTYPSLGVILLASLALGTVWSMAVWTGLAIAGGGLLAVMTRRRGLGLGDVKLFAVVGAGLGSSIPEIFGGSFVIGAFIVALRLLRRQIRFGETVPFAPFIATATILWLAYEGLWA